MKILFLSRWFPYPPDNGSKIRIFNLVKALASRHVVDLVSFAAEPVADEQVAAMQPYLRRMEVIPYEPFQPRRLKALLGFFSPRPRSVVDTYSASLQSRVEEAGRAQVPDVVIASQMDMAPYASTLLYPPKVLEEIELTTLHEGFVRQRHPLKKLRRNLTWWKMSRYTAGLLRAFAGCTVVSEEERQRLLQVAPGYRSVAIVPNGVDVAHYLSDFGAPEADTLVYSGALTYQANFDAVDFFLREVFPLIKSERPSVRLFITGRHAGAPIDRLTVREGVVFTGYLNDIRPRVARSWCSVVPLRIGGGTRLKILESLALGTPVVATGKGAEGLNLVAGQDLLMAEDPADFAAAVVRVLQSGELRTLLSQNGRRAVVARYDWASIGQRFTDFVERVAQRGQARPVLTTG